MKNKNSWFDHFPKLDFGLSPEYIAQTRQYVGRSYAAAFITAGIGIGVGLFLHTYKDPSQIKKIERIKENDSEKNKDS